MERQAALVSRDPVGSKAMQARAARHEPQTPGFGVQDTRFLHGRACRPASPWQAGVAAEKQHIAWRAGMLITALPDQCGGLESPHHPITRAAQTLALTFLPFHLR